MNKLLYTILAAATLAAFPARAETSAGTAPADRISVGKVTVDSIRLGLAADTMLSLRFNATIPRKAIRNTMSLTLTPVVSSGEWRVSMPPLLVEGRRFNNLRSRRAQAASDGTVVRATRGSSVRYTATVPLQEWMPGSTDLRFESVTAGCCSSAEPHTTHLPDSFRIPFPGGRVTDTIVYISYHKPEFVPETIGDSLSITFSFVLPEAMFDQNEPFRLYDKEKRNGLAVYYRQGASNIDKSLHNNSQTLKNLIAAINVILSSPSSEVAHIVVGGFASPEGPFEFNDRLAWERAVSVKEYIVTHTSVRPEIILVNNGSVDWRGLRKLVSLSDMARKSEVLDVIDTTPLREPEDHSLRLRKLKEIDGGTPYEYMYRNFFPVLRNGAFIKVYYKNLNDQPD